jgi:hypothetical protein
VDDVFRSVGGAISSAFQNTLDALEGLFQGAFGSASGTLGLPLLFLVSFVGLGALAWYLAKR